MIVVDASILANLVGDDGPDGRLARSLLDGVEPVAVPDLADVETAAVLRKRWIDHTLTERRLSAAVDYLAALPFLRFPARPLLPRILELRTNLTAYDAVYAALAEALSGTLLTADARLANAAGPRCPIRLVGLPRGAGSS